MKPMLAQSANLNRVPNFIADDDRSFEQKCDGIRLMVYVDDGKVRSENRGGNSVNLPPDTLAWFKQFSMPGVSFVFDGEFFTWNYRYFVFDLPYVTGVVGIEDTPFETRRSSLEMLFGKFPGIDRVQLLPIARTEAEKDALFRKMVDNCCEGIIVKHRDGLYVPGSRSKDMLKIKFEKTIDVVVTGLNIGGKDNLTFSVFDPKTADLVNIGKASTIGKPDCVVGEVIEVKYLYAVDPARPRLVQPTIMRKRTGEKSALECTIDQLEYTSKEVVV